MVRASHCHGLAVYDSPFAARQAAGIGEASVKPRGAAPAISLLLGNIPASAQVAASAYGSAPDLNYQAVPGMFQAPPGDTLGEMQGVATNSKGHVFSFFRGPQT